jgi:hypothetical protein
MAEKILQFFNCTHLSTTLQAVSKPFADLAMQMGIDLPDNEEKVVCLRRLLEAKDCAVRAALYREQK